VRKRRGCRAFKFNADIATDKAEKVSVYNAGNDGRPPTCYILCHRVGTPHPLISFPVSSLTMSLRTGFELLRLEFPVPPVAYQKRRLQ